MASAWWRTCLARRSCSMPALPATTIRYTRTRSTPPQVAGYPSVFAHGMLTMGLTGKMLTNYVGDGTLTKFGVRFTNQVWPGDTLEAKATVVGLREEAGQHYVDLALSTTNQDGKEVVSGSASARVDP